MSQQPEGVELDMERIRHLWHGLLASQRQMKAEPRFREIHGLGPAETETLDWVAEHPDVILRELGAALGTPKSTLTGLVDRLEKRGYLRRTINPRDRRSFGLVLTDPGRSAYAAHLRFEQAKWALSLQALGSRERLESFLAMLESITRAFLDRAAEAAHE